MPPSSSNPLARCLAAWLAPLLVLGCGCASHGVFASPASYSFFEAPDPDDPWSPKIEGWQHREQSMGDVEALAPASVSGAGIEASASHRSGKPDLRDKYFEFRAEQRRAQARELAEWIQQQAKSHYVPDGPLDHWATLEETLARNGDDCDGLELLVNHFLRDMGFGPDRVFRAIVYRPEDGQHHMVTLWFEDPTDPWVIDPTGAMTTGMPRMSEVAGWVPLKVFSESESFTARTLDRTSHPVAARRLPLR